jgi:hypothetical protein
MHRTMLASSAPKAAIVNGERVSVFARMMSV